MALDFGFDNTYVRDLDGFYASVSAAAVPQPRLLRLNRRLASELGLDAEALDSDLGAAIFSGNETPRDAQPIAQAYAGHQFGAFVPRLGDGRALLLGEVIDSSGDRFDLQLKGSGPTPFSRGGDGKAGVGPVLREYLVSEAMHALGIPTTRALAAVATGETIYRETPLPGAVLTRVAASHLRVGTFQYFAARREPERVRRLADYSIARHYPEVARSDTPYLDFFAAVVEAQASLVARWLLVGFIHGVMNTDNTSIAGETIDYGPCAFMDAYDPTTVFSSIDSGGRYAYGNQPAIAVWNLARLAETLLPWIDSDEERAAERATAVLERFAAHYGGRWLAGMRRKLGLVVDGDGAGGDAERDAADRELAADFLHLLQAERLDYTLAFRGLSRELSGVDSPVAGWPGERQAFEPWAERWRARLAEVEVAAETRAEAMNRTNPIYVPRNHKVEEALDAAVSEGSLEPFEALLAVLETPYEERPGGEEYAAPAPASFGPYRTFCGT